jgi:hypothetical protein
MTLQTINIQLPDTIYQRLQRMADAINKPLEEVVFQTIQGNLPPSLDDLSPGLRTLVAEMQRLGDEELWAIAHNPLPPQQWRRHQHLLHKTEAETLSSAEQRELEELRAVTDQFVTRRSYALALLKWRGHTLPTNN